MKQKKSLQVKKIKKIVLAKKVKDQHEVDFLGGKCLKPNHLLHSGLLEWKTKI
jgi:hypothetical protein